jgi:hypothetical protein
MALILLVDKIASAIENGEFVVGVFLDFQKAFDTVNHSILLRKLQRYGIRGKAYQWLEDYLSHRQQYVSFAESNSKRTVIKCGVPQGSILGPLLFLLYINDLVQTSNSFMPILFADDTNVFLKGRSLQEIISIFNNELNKLVNWLNANKLSLNITKTHYIIFRSKRQCVVTNNKLSINGSIIENVEHTKFLGVTIDSTLSWDRHISNVKGKIARGLGVISKARKSLNSQSLITLYFSIIYPYLIYCVEVWGNAAAVYINSLFRLQKKVLKVIKSVPIRYSSKLLFDEMKLLTVKEIHLHCSLMFIFKFLKGKLPSIFQDFYVRNSAIRDRQTRQTTQLHLPMCRTAFYGKTIKIWGVKIWNEKAHSLNQCCSLHTFKRKLKQNIMRSRS